MGGCNCEPPPVFDIGPPPDPSLIWHLLSDEPFEKVEDCEWDPFLSVNEILKPTFGRDSPNLRHVPLALAALAAVLLLVLLVTICILRSRRLRLKVTAKKQQHRSTDAILPAATTGDAQWSYNSMKTSASASNHGSMGVLMYGGEDAVRYPKAIAVTPHVNQNLRSLPRHVHDLGGPLRQSQTTIRLHGEPGNYCTIGRHYEEIPAMSRVHGGSQIVALSTPPSLRVLHAQQLQRQSIRKPPPTCRPPPPPNELAPSSASDSSLERELDGIESSPSPKRWQEAHVAPEGRESGYGTGPSRNWVSPRLQRSSTRPETAEGAPKPIPLAVFAQQKAAHSMTYV